MNEILADLLDVCAVVYLDDILIYSENLEEHRQHVKEVLKRLRKHKLYVSSPKCSFHQDKIEFLGYIISTASLQMDESKVQTTRDWPVPRRVKDVQSFLGFANFYRRFIKGYSELSAPLTFLTQKTTSWTWTMDCEEAFNTIKRAFTSAPTLKHWDPDSPLVLETNASDLALAAILSIQTEGNIHPIAFHSRSLHTAELNYDVHDKELLAIVEAFKKWRHYLEGTATPVEVITDHKNLTYFCSSKLLTRRQARWSEYLSQFNFSIKFRPGRLEKKPDALIHRWDVYNQADVPSKTAKQLMFTPEQLTDAVTETSAPTLKLQAATITDLTKLLMDIREALQTDPVFLKLAESDGTHEDNRWGLREDGLLYFENQIYVPESQNLQLQVV